MKKTISRLFIVLIFCFVGFFLGTNNAYGLGIEKDITLSTAKERTIVLKKGSKLRQKFTSPRNNLGGVGIKFALFNRIGQGELTFKICQPPGNCFYQYDLETTHLGNKDFYFFGFPKISDSKGKEYYLELENKTISPKTKIGVFLKGKNLVLKTLHEFKLEDLKKDENRKDLAQDFIGGILERFKENKFKILVLTIFISSLFVVLKFETKTNLALLILIVMAIFLRVYKLDFEFRDDAYFTVSPAYGFFKTGKFFRWDFLQDKLTNIYYPRSWPHLVLLALSFKIFGFSETSARLVSVFFSIVLILISFFAIKDIFKKNFLALVFVSLLVFDPFLIGHSRYVRMYGLFIPLFFLGSFLLEKALNSGKGKFVWRGVNLIYLLLAIATFYFSYQLHPLGLSILAGLISFILFKAFVFKKREIRKNLFFWLFISICFCLLILVLKPSSIKGPLKKLLRFSGILQKPNFEYLRLLFPGWPLYLSWILFIFSGVYLSLIEKNKHLKERLAFYYLVILTVLLFFIFIGKRYPRLDYIGHIIFLAKIFLLYGAFKILSKIKLEKYLILLSLVPLFGLFQNWDKFYGEQHHGYGLYRKAYQEIRQQYRPGEVILAQYGRKEYLVSEKTFKKANYLDMGRKKEFSFAKFLSILRKYPHGWITWESQKYWHIDPKILEYCEKNLKKLHGTKIDKTGVEVYYW